MSKLQHTEVVMRYIMINIGVLNCDFQIQCVGTVIHVSVSKVRFVRISWCSISDCREQYEQSMCDLQCSL